MKHWKHMACYAILVGVLINCSEKRESKEAEVQQVEDEQLLFPFNRTASIVILSYENRNNWQNLKPEEILVRDSSWVLQLAGLDLSDRAKESVLIEGDQIEELYEILYRAECSEAEDISFCYDPRHLFLFKNTADSVLAGLEICLDCTNGLVSEGMVVPTFCETKFMKMKDFLRSAGIAYYGEF